MIKQKKYHITTIGCQMNKSDSERMANYLEDYGLESVKKRAEADLVVINTCGVRQSAEDRIYGLIPGIKKDNKNAKIIITGCLSARPDVQERLKGWVDLWFPIVHLPGLDKELDNLFSEKGVEKLKDFGSRNDYLKIRPKLESHFSAFVPIGNGCNNFCAYCVVPYARGREVYRNAGEIVKEAKDLVENGYKEITLIAQNVNSYKKNGVGFPELLKKVNDIQGDFWLKFATSHPKDMSDELIKVIADCEKVCHHIHLPAQSGDNEILKAMNRKYTREHYLELIKKIRKACDGKKVINEFVGLPASISTDIIVGFPGEGEESFKNTKELFREVKFDLAYISQYSPRYGTAASKMKDDVSKVIKKQREEGLVKILRKTAKENNKRYIGNKVRVLIEGKNKKGEYYGKTCTYKNVIIKGGERFQVGGFAPVKIEKAMDFGLVGRHIKTPE